jgi:hypothetical protein
LLISAFSIFILYIAHLDLFSITVFLEYFGRRRLGVTSQKAKQLCIMDSSHYRNPGLCRVPEALPSAFCRALGKVLRSVKSLFTECRTLGTAKHSTKNALPSVKHSAKTALGKGPLAAVYS